MDLRAAMIAALGAFIAAASVQEIPPFNAILLDYGQFLEVGRSRGRSRWQLPANLFTTSTVNFTCEGGRTDYTPFVAESLESLKAKANGLDRAWCGLAYEVGGDQRTCLTSWSPFRDAYVAILPPKFGKVPCFATRSFSPRPARALAALVALVVFWNASRLSRSSPFRLASGGALFALLSVAVLLAFAFRRLPARRAAVAWLVAAGGGLAGAARYAARLGFPGLVQAATSPLGLSYLLCAFLLGLAVTYWFDEGDAGGNPKVAVLLSAALRLGGLATVALATPTWEGAALLCAAAALAEFVRRFRAWRKRKGARRRKRARAKGGRGTGDALRERERESDRDERRRNDQSRGSRRRRRRREDQEEDLEEEESEEEGSEDEEPEEADPRPSRVLTRRRHSARGASSEAPRRRETRSTAAAAAAAAAAAPGRRVSERESRAEDPAASGSDLAAPARARRRAPPTPVAKSFRDRTTALFRGRRGPEEEEGEDDVIVDEDEAELEDLDLDLPVDQASDVSSSRPEEEEEEDDDRDHDRDDAETGAREGPSRRRAWSLAGRAAAPVGAEGSRTGRGRDPPGTRGAVSALLSKLRKKEAGGRRGVVESAFEDGFGAHANATTRAEAGELDPAEALAAAQGPSAAPRRPAALDAPPSRASSGRALPAAPSSRSHGSTAPQRADSAASQSIGSRGKARSARPLGANPAPPAPPAAPAVAPALSASTLAASVSPAHSLARSMQEPEPVSPTASARREADAAQPATPPTATPAASAASDAEAPTVSPLVRRGLALNVETGHVIQIGKATYQKLLEKGYVLNATNGTIARER